MGCIVFGVSRFYWVMTILYLLQNFDYFIEFVWLGTGVAYCISCLLTKARKENLFRKTIRTTVVVVKYTQGRTQRVGVKTLASLIFY